MNTRLISRPRYGGHSAYALSSGDFKCTHCHSPVSALPELSGVRNRNHCPYCLWSRHLDWQRAGDRLSACKAPMQPLGLALKQRRKRYAPAQGGELMLIHQCSACGKLSLNRIAADDNNYELYEVFERSLALDNALFAQISASGISPLQTGQQHLLQARLFGKN